MAEQKTIFVKSALKQKEDGSHPLAIFEQDARHPAQKDAAGKEIPGSKGEAWVAGEVVVEVFPTKGIISALRNDRIVEVTKSGDVKAKSGVEAQSFKDAEELSETEKSNAPSDDEKTKESAKQTGGK